MRSGPNKRSRGRNNNGGSGGNMMNGHNNNGGGNRQRSPHRQQTFDSNGPGIKIRGNAYQVFERYVALAREAASAGDRIAAENFYQHAEHYFRIMNANGENPAHMMQRPTTPADPMPDTEAEGEGEAVSTSGAESEQAEIVEAETVGDEPESQPA
ncbi:MAG TPA: DUF4167 domain-containing protein [Stellaceae bacterium]|jgi:hypothetical protein|nr:DUF4167 domain-containing protein [Stellaceae bacterium]